MIFSQVRQWPLGYLTKAIVSAVEVDLQSGAPAGVIAVSIMTVPLAVKWSVLVIADDELDREGHDVTYGPVWTCHGPLLSFFFFFPRSPNHYENRAKKYPI